jgi:hypothetical protein
MKGLPLLGPFMLDASNRVLAAIASLSPRERALGCVLSGLAGLSLAAMSIDFAYSQYERASIAASALKMRAEESRASSNEEGLRVTRQMERVREHAFADTTIAIAQLQAEAELEAMLRAAGVADPRVTVLGVAPETGDVRLATFQIEGIFDWGSFGTFVGDLSTSDKRTDVLSISVDQTGGKRFRLKLRIPVTLSRRPE